MCGICCASRFLCALGRSGYADCVTKLHIKVWICTPHPGSQLLLLAGFVRADLLPPDGYVMQGHKFHQGVEQEDQGRQQKVQ